MTHENLGPPRKDIVPQRELTLFGAANLREQMLDPGYIILPRHTVVDLSIVSFDTTSGRNTDKFDDLNGVSLQRNFQWRAVGDEFDIEKQRYFALLVPDSFTRRGANITAKKFIKNIRDKDTITSEEREYAMGLRAIVDSLDGDLAKRVLQIVTPSLVKGINCNYVNAVVCKVRTDKAPKFVNVRGR